jgi:hypothetical protein
MTRTRCQWAELVALWYTVHSSTPLERLRLLLVVWWLGRRRRLEEPCTIRLDPEAFGVRTSPTLMMIKSYADMINPRPCGVKPDPPPAPPRRRTDSTGTR